MSEVRQIKAGDIIFTQTIPPKEIAILQSGTAELLSVSDDYDGVDPQIILRHSSRIMLIKEPGIIVGHSPLLTGACSKSVRAVSDCSLMSYPLNAGGFEEIAAADPNAAGTMLRQIYNRINSAAVNEQKYVKLCRTICVMSDNLSLMYAALAGSGAPAALESKASSLNQNFLSAKAAFPQQFTAQFVITDNGRFLGKHYTIPGEPAESAMQKDIVRLIKRLLSVNKQVFTEMIKADKGIAAAVCETLTGVYDGIISRIGSADALMNKELHSMFGNEDSWSDYLVNNDGFAQWKNSNKLDGGFVKNFLSLIIKLNSVYEELIGEKIIAGYPGIKLIHNYYSSESKPKEKEKEEVKQPAAEAGVQLQDSNIADLKNSINTIFNFTLVDKDFQTHFLKLLNDFKTSKTPFGTDSDVRRIRTQLTKFYWDVYKQAYIRSRAEKNVPKPVKLMLTFGFFDETLLEQERLIELNQLIAVKEPQPALSVLKEIEFLSLLSEDKEIPSITEMGLTYEAFLREEAKQSSGKKRDEAKEDTIDEKTKIVMYEIGHRTSETSAVCSGSRSTAFPILTSQLIKSSLTEYICTKAKVETAVKNVMNIDFSLFYRETVLKIKEAREIIQEEVTPYVILLPIFGTNTLLWQEMSGTNKKSRARITIPIFFMGDLEKDLARTLACYRWELNRSIKGAMWADPIEGGLTGEYFDYVNTYKKNSKLSPEVKEKLAEQFKSLRTNRDRFANDYLLWLYYEKDGIMKLNSVVREMFYKHIPMSKGIREQLANLPAFTNYATRYKNIQRRDLDHCEHKFKKYQDSDGHYPPEIEKYFEFLKS